MVDERHDDAQTVLAEIGRGGVLAERMAIIEGALRSGFLEHCARPRTAADLSTATGLPPSRVVDICAALRAAGVFSEEPAGTFRLTSGYAALVREGSTTQALSSLNASAVRQRLLPETFTKDGPTVYGGLSDEDRAALAAGVTWDPASALARQRRGNQIAAIPVWHERFSAGGRHLELGCGLAGGLLTYLQLYPKLTGVGVDLYRDLIDRARVKADSVGVGDRVTFVVGDALTFEDPEPFDSAHWSQFFFPTATRAGALANAYARLRPGGLLLAPVAGLSARPDDVVAAVRVLLNNSWDVPMLTGPDLVAELTAAGFAGAEMHPGLFTSVVTAVRP